MFPSRSKSPKGKRPLLLPPRALLEPTRREESTNQSIMQDQNSQTQKRPRSQNIDPSKLTKLKIQFSRYRIYFDGVPAAKVRLLKPEIEKAGAVQDAYSRWWSNICHLK